MQRPPKMHRLTMLSAAALVVATGPAFSADWFYGHPAPTVSGAVAYKLWQDCIASAAARLDDYASSVMDVASAIQPLCSAQEDTMIDAINKEFLDKNSGAATYITLQAMEQTRQEARASHRQTIGTIILTLRKSRK